MLDKLLSIFQTNSVHRLALVTSIAANIIKTFEQEFPGDSDARDAAIDTLISLLQSQKGKPAPVVPSLN